MTDDANPRPGLEPVDGARSRCVVLVDDGSGPDDLGAELRKLRGGWNVGRASDAHGGLALCDRERADVVIVDVNVPPTGGLDLLQRIEELHPETLRVIRFRRSDPTDVVSALRVVHQMIPRVCDPRIVTRLIDRLCHFRDDLASEDVRSRLGSPHELPVRSSVHLRIRMKLDDPDVGVADVARLLQEDVALSSRVLQLANSPLFGTRQPIVTIQNAITHLGLNPLKRLILVEEIFAQALERGRDRRFPTKGFPRHALLTAQIARSIRVGLGLHEDAFVAGMLHGFGDLILHVTGLDPELVPAPAAGGYVLGTWGLPPLITEVVACHREPWRVEPAEFGVVGTVHLANLLAERLEAEGRGGAWSALPDRTMEYLDDVGVADDLTGWREVVARVGFDVQAPRPRLRRQGSGAYRPR
jgi:HD-like signal output (HDOD) protein/CheY-like chemotaxis protein